MVKLIMDVQGTGKTKQLAASINEAVKNESGSIVCIEKGDKLRYDINYRVRLINAEDYRIGDAGFMQGFISGLHAGNFDISHIFIDSLYKIIGHEPEQAAEFCRWCDEFSQKNDIRFTFTVSGDPTTAPEGMKKYF